VSPELVLVANLLVAGALLAVAVSSQLVRVLSRHSWALAGLPLLTVVLVTAYVFGEDSYRGSGISRWDAYRSPGGALGPMFVLSIALLAACAALLFYGGARNSDRLVRATSLAGAVISVLLVTPTILGFTLN
jgi:cell division protein FtsW (lipid II flippase)